MPQFRWRRMHLHTVADPFLLVANDKLWLFVEEQRHESKGCIVAWSTDNYFDWTKHGVVLREETHLSYPQVFEHDGNYWMIPENGESGSVWLYAAKMLPGPWRRSARLLDTPHWDATLLSHQGRCYIWATDEQKTLRLYHADRLQGPYVEHAASPITQDLRYSRCGGPILSGKDGAIYRLAQDCAQTYGRNLHVVLIKALSRHEYKEALVESDILSNNDRWNSNGAHHMSFARYKGRTVCATDGLGPDFVLNTFAKFFWRVIRPFFRRRH